VPPTLPTEAVVGEMLKLQDAAACVTVTVCPATVTVPVREVVAVFAATVSVVVPLPEPLAGDTVIQAAFEDAVHVHPLVAFTVRLVVPPPLPTDALVGDTVNEHGLLLLVNVNGLDGPLRPVPSAPAAATRDS
jgi:hypothetical protein